MTIFDYNTLSPGLLSSPQITILLKQGLLLENFSEECIGPATYHMRIGGRFITCKNGQTQEFKLGERDNPSQGIRSRVSLSPNSLTFITTYEKFKLPNNIIARFNLKSKWVHRGILLGTGPIVDPELNAYLLIPLHNFSNSSIEIPYLSEIISVEFTKTHDPNQRYEINGKKCEYIINKSKNFKIDEYIERVGTNLPESSIAAQLTEVETNNKQISQQFNEFKSKIQKYSIVGAVAMAIALASLVTTITGLISDANKYVSDSKHQYSATIQQLSSRIDELQKLISNDQKQSEETRIIQENPKPENIEEIDKEEQ